jgi:hypothetical protein
MSHQPEYRGSEYTGSTDSESLTISDAFVLGSRLEYIRRAAKHNYKVGESEDNQLLNAIIEVEQALRRSGIDTVVARQIQDFRANIESEYESDDTLDSMDARDLEEKSGTWWNMILAELKRQRRIPASDTGLMDQIGLIEEPESLFASGVWDWLDERPRSDIQEAAKTLVVDCTTSSVVLSLRAVEHCLREWYEYEHEPIEDAPWGQVLDYLMEEYVEEEKKNDTVLTQLSDLPPVLTNLYYLKEKRNEVNHPEKSPNPHEARQTLMIVASTITEIFDYITERELKELDSLEPPMEYDNSKEYVHQIMNMLEEQYEEGIPRAAIHKADEMFESDLTRSEIDDGIQDVLMDGLCYEPADDKYKPI